MDELKKWSFFFCQKLELNTVLATDIEKDQHLELQVQPDFVIQEGVLHLHHHKDYLTSLLIIQEESWDNLGFQVKT